MDPIEKLLKVLRQCLRAGFFGKISISFQNGRVGSVTVEQVSKLEEL